MRSLARWILIASALLLWGCPVNKQTDVYYILLAQVPRLTDQTVYAHGQPIGQLQNKKVGFSSICELTLSIDPAFRERLLSSSVFYAQGGQLHLGQLSPSVDPLPKGGRMLGFSSLNALRWYRFKHMLGSPDAMADAERLFTRMQWQTPVDLPL
jgi:hypothetical protein